MLSLSSVKSAAAAYPGMLSGPAAFCMFTLLRVLQTSAVSKLSACSSGCGIAFLAVLSVSNLPKYLFSSLRKLVLFTRGGGAALWPVMAFDTLPHAFGVHRVMKEILCLLTMGTLCYSYGTVEVGFCCSERHHVSSFKDVIQCIEHCTYLLSHPGFLVGPYGDVLDDRHLPCTS